MVICKVSLHGSIVMHVEYESPKPVKLHWKPLHSKFSAAHEYWRGMRNSLAASSKSSYMHVLGDKGNSVAGISANKLSPALA